MFKKIKYIDGKYRSEFDILMAKTIICPLFGHTWVWWRLIERSKCDRCFITFEEEAKEFELSAAFRFLRQENEYRRLQTPFWKMMGHKMTPEEMAVERWMKERNMDYYDLQKLRDKKAGASHQKDMNRINNPSKVQPVEYEKGSVNI